MQLRCHHWRQACAASTHACNLDVLQSTSIVCSTSSTNVGRLSLVFLEPSCSVKRPILSCSGVRHRTRGFRPQAFRSSTHETHWPVSSLFQTVCAWYTTTSHRSRDMSLASRLLGEQMDRVASLRINAPKLDAFRTSAKKKHPTALHEKTIASYTVLRHYRIPLACRTTDHLGTDRS